MQQREILEIMNKYNTMSRKVITENLFHVKAKGKFRRSDIIIDLGFEKEKVAGWYNRKNPCVPLFEDALRLSVTYGFDIVELVNERNFGYMKGVN